MALSILPEVGPDASCLDLLNFFQTGRSHILLVSKVKLLLFNSSKVLWLIPIATLCRLLEILEELSVLFRSRMLSKR